MGGILPKMGISGEKRLDSGGAIADALFSSTQKRVLGLLFGRPERSFFATEIFDKVQAGTGAVQRELKKLEQSRLVTVKRIGNQKHYQANPDSPVYEELLGLIVKTVGIVGPVQDAVQKLKPEPELALIYGSVAKNEFDANSDVDLLLVSDRLSLENVYEQLSRAEEMIGRQINPTLYTVSEYRERKESGAHFLKSVLTGPTITLIGDIERE